MIQGSEAETEVMLVLREMVIAEDDTSQHRTGAI